MLCIFASKISIGLELSFIFHANIYVESHMNWICACVCVWFMNHTYDAEKKMFNAFFVILIHYLLKIINHMAKEKLMASNLIRVIQTICNMIVRIKRTLNKRMMHEIHLMSGFQRHNSLRQQWQKCYPLSKETTRTPSVWL